MPVETSSQQPPPVSIDAYVDQTAALLDLKIPNDIRASVVDNFAQIVAIARPVLDFELPDDLESAATFEP